jgi:SAM-dependent methyltransferase
MYPGFNQINKFPSIIEQRSIQRKYLRNILNSSKDVKIKLLSIGVGDGEELNMILLDSNLVNDIEKIYCIDKVDNYFQPSKLPNLKFILNKIYFIKQDIKKLYDNIQENEFDIIQCGFLMHEIEYEHKDRVINLLNNLLKAKGILICSDIDMDNFVRNDREEDNKRKRNIISLYNKFIAEAKKCLKNKVMTMEEFNLLCGDGRNNGLLFSKNNAINGLDDYYEPLKTITDRINRCGFNCEDIFINSKSRSLFVICARKIEKQ